MEKILIIDDERTILDNLSFILELEDYEVLSAPSGPEGVEMFRRVPGIAAVISDMRMPGMSGMDVVKAIRAINPEMGVIILTGHGDMDNAVATMKAGAFDYLNKPVNADKLLITLENAIRRYTLQRENKQLQADILKKNTYLQGLHDSAQQILIQLVPDSPPSQFPDVRAASVYKPCDAVGGDMYDVFELGDKLFFYIFDVCSHGILAAVITMIIKSFFDSLRRMQAYMDVAVNLTELMAGLNLEMVRNTPSNMYATLFCGYYDRTGKTITYLSAGHIDQMLLHQGEWTALPSTGTMVGLFDFAEFETGTVSVAEGDKLYLFTDGLTEVWEGDQIINSDHVLDLLKQYADLDIQENLNEMYEEILDLAGGKSLDDDLTILGLAF